MAALLLLAATFVLAQENKKETYRSSGMLSIGTRNTFSLFDDDNGYGKGIGLPYGGNNPATPGCQHFNLTSWYQDKP